MAELAASSGQGILLHGLGGRVRANQHEDRSSQLLVKLRLFKAAGRSGIVDIFIGSSAMTMAISAIAIVIFLGLTAYDTQQIREMVSEQGATNAQEVIGALTLYLDFINIFVNLLQLFGSKDD